MTLVTGLRRAEVRLSRLDMTGAIADALEAAAQKLETMVVDALSQPPGQDHSTPWTRTGALRSSIGHSVDGNVAIVGSSSDVAVDQELGTRAIPPRPFLASTSAACADEVLASIASVLARHLADR